MTHDEAIRLLLWAKGLIDHMRLKMVIRVAEWNQLQLPRPTGITIDVTCEIVDQHNSADPKAGPNHHHHEQ
jgi:hypothetical protein